MLNFFELFNVWFILFRKSRVGAVRLSTGLPSMCPRFHSQCTQIILVFRSLTRMTNLFTNAVFPSPEVKFQVYEKLKYGEEK